MANKKLLGNVTGELRLPTKKAKGEKKLKWQAKLGGKKAKEVEVVEPVGSAVETPVSEVEQPQKLPRLPETPTDDITIEPAPTVEPAESTPADESTPATDPEAAPTKP